MPCPAASGSLPQTSCPAESGGTLHLLFTSPSQGSHSPLHPGSPTFLSICELLLNVLHSLPVEVSPTWSLLFVIRHPPRLRNGQVQRSLSIKPGRPSTQGKIHTRGRCRRGWSRVCNAQGRTGGKHLNVCVIHKKCLQVMNPCAEYEKKEKCIAVSCGRQP